MRNYVYAEDARWRLDMPNAFLKIPKQSVWSQNIKHQVFWNQDLNSHTSITLLSLNYNS